MNRLYHWFWESGIDYFLYSFLLIVVIWTSKNIMMSSLRTKYSEWNYRYRIRQVRNQVELSSSKVYKNPFLKHIYLLLRTTREERNDADVLVFFIISGMLTVLSSLFILIVVVHDILISSIFGLLIGFVPYLILRLRLNKLRYLMSLEFLSIVIRITQHYNANHYDMYTALTETQKEIKTKELRMVIVKLITDLQVSRNEHELRESIKVFTYTAGTNWAKRLGSIIMKAYLYDENVLNALMTLTKQIEDTEEMLEQEKSQTLDSVYNGYFTLPVFIGALILGYYSSGAQDWFKLQFGHTASLFLFLLSLVGVIFSMIIAIFLKQPKNDL